jgi:hypothetical protein
MMGLESLGKQNVADEQAKAAEEFKKTIGTTEPRASF